jgi:hypothetical protein
MNSGDPTTAPSAPAIPPAANCSHGQIILGRSGYILIERVAALNAPIKVVATHTYNGVATPLQEAPHLTPFFGGRLARDLFTAAIQPPPSAHPQCCPLSTAEGGRESSLLTTYWFKSTLSLR